VSKKFTAGFVSLAVALSLLTPAVVLPAQAAPNAGVTITDAWIRSSEYSDHIGGMTGIFAKITNRTNHTVVLTGGSTKIAPMVQTHQVINGVMSHKDGGIKIAKGATVTLQPGGLHVMLMNLQKPIVAGDIVKFTFAFKGAKSQTFNLVAKPVVAGGESYSPSPAPTN